MSKRAPNLAANLKAVARAPDRPAVAKGHKPYFAATRVGMKKVTVTLDPGMRKALKRLATDDEVTVEALVRNAIADLLAKRQ